MSSDQTERRALEVAFETAAAAGALLLEGVGGRHQTAIKRNAIDLVTEFDHRAEDLIVARLQAAFPDDAILTEERGQIGGGTRTRWLIDPLDGTTNFAHGLPLFTVSIARQEAGLVTVAVVAAPALDLTFVARRGGGASLNGAPIRVSGKADLGESLLVTGFPYDCQTSDDNNFEQFIAFHRRTRGVRRLGSAALDLSFVAMGALDGYWEMKLKPWDVAAGTLLVEEAGGRVSSWRGGALRLEGGALVASNGVIHESMLRLLGDLGIPEPARN